MNTTTSTTSAPKRPPLIEKTVLVTSAWLNGAPAANFGGMTREEFAAATAPSKTAREVLEAIIIEQRGKIAQKNTADAASRLLCNRFVIAVKASDLFGTESPLYRGMGFIPPSEFKSPSQSGTPVKKPATRGLIERLKDFTTAWETFAPDLRFAGITLQELKTQSLPSFDIRVELASGESNRKAAVGTRNLADVATRTALNQVVAGVKADPAFGSNCALYRAMGYIPTSERKSVTRKPKVTTPAIQP